MVTGRPSSYREEFNEKAKEYIASEELPSIVGFAKYLGTCVKTLYNWAEKHERFLHTLDDIKQEYELKLTISGLKNDYNANLVKFLLSAKLGMSEKQEVKQENSGSVGLNVNFNTVAPSDYDPDE